MRQIDAEISNLKEMILRMSDTVISNIKLAVKNYTKNKQESLINDDIVDNYERIIQEICLQILIKERTYAKDLRLVSGILKLSSDLERIGDIAEDLDQFTNKLYENKVKSSKEINDMLNKALDMVEDSIESYIKEDILLAKNVIMRDDIIDRMYDEQVEGLIVKNVEEPTSRIYTALVVKYVERIADHAVNIAEWAVYIVNGYYKDKQLL